jgi:hypothetical protein
MEEQRPWHRLFGLSWMDFFHGQPVKVEMEKDLSLKRQPLDVVLIRKEAEGLTCRLPDGFEGLARFNLLSFKSHQQKLSVWGLQELVGHYVNLRKQQSPGMDEDELLPAEQFRLFAVSARFPQQLAGQPEVALREVTPGVYEVGGLGLSIRVVVPNQLPRAEHNALLHLFSTRAELLGYGARHYRAHSSQTSTLLLQLLHRFRQEIKELPLEKRLEGLSAEQRVQGLSAEERVRGLSPEELIALAGKLKGNGSPAKPE